MIEILTRSWLASAPLDGGCHGGCAQDSAADSSQRTNRLGDRGPGGDDVVDDDHECPINSGSRKRSGEVAFPARSGQSRLIGDVAAMVKHVARPGRYSGRNERFGCHLRKDPHCVVRSRSRGGPPRGHRSQHQRSRGARVHHQCGNGSAEPSPQHGAE